jgi:hypothetical protein
MKRMSIYITPSHVSITVANGTSRETSGSDLRQVLDAMPAADRDVLEKFCYVVLGLPTLTTSTEAK